MARIIHSFVSGGSNCLWDSILPSNRSDAEALIVGHMCLYGRIEAHSFSDEDRAMLRKIIEISELPIPTPSLEIRSKLKLSSIPKRDVVTGGVYHLTIRVCVYGYGKRNAPIHLGIYNASLVYIPATTNTSPHMLELYDRNNRYIHSSGYNSETGQYFYFEVAEMSRVDLFTDSGLTKLLTVDSAFGNKIVANAKLA